MFHSLGAGGEDDPFPVESTIEQLVDRVPDRAEFHDRSVSVATALATGGLSDDALRAT